MPKREKIYISEEAHGFYEMLKGAAESLSSPFQSFRDIFLVAAIFGYRNNAWVPLRPGERKDIFAWITLENDKHALPILQALVLDKTKEPKDLLDDDKVAEIAEGYANGGIKILIEKLSNIPNKLEGAALIMTELLNEVIDEDSENNPGDQ